MNKLISELSEKEINSIIWRIENINEERKFYIPCRITAQAWPIIKKNRITVMCSDNESSAWDSKKGMTGGVWKGSNGLIAAMRCRIAMVYGESVDVDDE